MGYLRDHNDDIDAVILGNAPGNCKLIAPSIQQDLTCVCACASETINVILKDIGDSLFFILVYESRDVSTKEQMSVVLRYVDSSGFVKEQFIGVEHVSDTTTLSLKEAIDKIFSKYNLSISRLRGQGYDGASNMKGGINGLKAIILNENSSAYYTLFIPSTSTRPCSYGKKDSSIADLFRVVTQLVNFVGGSCKRSHVLREKPFECLVEALKNGEISSGQGLNQESSIQRAGETRWGSHYRSLVRLISLFSPVGDMLDVFYDDEYSTSIQKVEIETILKSMHSFEFVLNLHMMKIILGISNDLSQSLQMRDQDIVNAMGLVEGCRKRLCKLRDDGWDS